MKAKDLRDRSTEDLAELCAMLRKDLFNYRMRNHTNQLDDTSLMRKTRRDIARIEHVLRERGLADAEAPAADGGNQQ
jgi:large subunit ribosomal protein L29